MGVAEGTGATLELTQRGQDPVASLRFMPSADWQRFELTRAVPEGVAGELLALLRLEPHLAVQTRNVTLDTDAGRARPLPHTRRQALWYAQPNLLGHMLAVATVLVVLTSSSPLLLASGIILGFVGIWLTGSRAAYGAALLGRFLVGLVAFTPSAPLVFVGCRRPAGDNCLGLSRTTWAFAGVWRRRAHQSGDDLAHRCAGVSQCALFGFG